MHATAVIDTIAIDAIIEDGDEKLVPIGGIAHAGARGISKVEVQVDSDGVWHEAMLRKPLSDTTWVIWRYDWPFVEGRHEFEVRTYEADGTPADIGREPTQAKWRDWHPLEGRNGLGSPPWNASSRRTASSTRFRFICAAGLGNTSRGWEHPDPDDTPRGYLYGLHIM